MWPTVDKQQGYNGDCQLDVDMVVLHLPLPHLHPGPSSDSLLPSRLLVVKIFMDLHCQIIRFIQFLYEDALDSVDEEGSCFPADACLLLCNSTWII